VPNDSARDLPDVSLFASDGHNKSFYIMCQSDANVTNTSSCDLNSPYTDFQGVGGTSVAAPTFAGIMALMIQKTGGRVGNANYVLYKLAAQSGASCASNSSAVSNGSCIFYDVVKGNNSVACIGGSLNCSNTNKTAGQYGIMVSGTPPSPAWSTTAGYDLATGLGSVNAANLVNNWASVSFSPTATALSLSTTPATNPITLTHGQQVNVTINVTSSSGTPTGAVSLLGGPTSPQGIADFALSNGTFSGTTDMLPGGNYSVTAHYAGDGSFGASDSSPVQVTVNPEGSLTKVGLVTFDLNGNVTSTNATAAPYGSPYVLRVDVANSSGQLCAPVSPGSFVPGPTVYPCPTGQVAVTANGQPPTETGNPPGSSPGIYSLNSQGYAEDAFIQLLPGPYNLVASYAGDNSYTSSKSSTDAVTITKAATTSSLAASASSVPSGTNVVLVAVVNTQSNGAAPTGTVQFLNGTTPLPGTVTYTGNAGSGGAFASLRANLTTTISANTSLTAQYSGDTNYVGSTSPPISITVSDFSLSANPTSINIPAPGQSGNTMVTITPSGGFAGTVAISCSGTPVGATCTPTPASVSLKGSTAATATVSIATTAKTEFHPRTPKPTVPPSLRLRFGLPWFLAGLLALAMLIRLAASRRQVALVFALATVVVGVWAACGGGGGGGGSSGPPVPGISLSASSLTFNSQNMGSTSAAQSVTVSNPGSASLNISSIVIKGTNASDFSEKNNCGNGVAAGSSCAVSVTFSPSATGSRSASLAVSDNATGSPQMVSLSGTGVPPATPPGSYMISVTATSGTLSHSTQITLTVQ
jgi:hypothetical protein